MACTKVDASHDNVDATQVKESHVGESQVKVEASEIPSKEGCATKTVVSRSMRSSVISFFGKPNGDIIDQMELFNDLISLTKSSSRNALLDGILAITAHNTDTCDEECFVGKPSIRIIPRINYITELFEDLWWTENGASTIFCKKAEQVKDVSVYLDEDCSGTTKSVVCTAKLGRKRVTERVTVAIIDSIRTNTKEYHIIESGIKPSDSHPIFIELYEGSGIVVAERGMLCTHYSLKHFIEEFGYDATHEIEDDQFIPIN